MRGDDLQQAGMSSYLSPEERVPAEHPLRAIRKLSDAVFAELSPQFDKLYARMGRPSIAPEKLLRAGPLGVTESAKLGYAYAVSGNRAEAEKMLGQLQALSLQKYVPSFLIALIYVGLGDKDQAFAWLEKAYAERSVWMPWLKVDPEFDTLRSDPRFVDLQGRIGFST
jgi:tetratricopeptide (TPR) repeat protein